jgi:Class III cytochrome C family
VVLGVLGYRFDVAIVAFSRPAGVSYFPTGIELSVSVGIVAGALLVFIFFVERLRVYPEEAAAVHAHELRPPVDPHSTRSLLPMVVAAPRRYSMGFVLGAAVAAGVLPPGAMFGSPSVRTPVAAARVVPGVVTERTATPGHDLRVDPAAARGARSIAHIELMVIDGNRNGRAVLFPHDLHVNALGGDNSCASCHHARLPFSRLSSCAACHQDMYSRSDMFDHGVHVARLGGNAGCARCHADAGGPKTRASATPCDHCHAQMLLANSRVPRPKVLGGWAASYVDAMHRLCITCHAERHTQEPGTHPANFAECRNCHRDAAGTPVRKLEPYSGGPRVSPDDRVGG